MPALVLAVLAAHIAPMVERGHTWVFDTALTYYNGDEPMKKVTERVKVTCKVDQVISRKRATISHIACDPYNTRKLLVAGWFAANSKGLWFIGEPDDDTPTDDIVDGALTNPPLIAAAPKAFDDMRRIDWFDKVHNRIFSGVRASSRPGGWCTWEDSSDADPDGGHISTCFAPGVGLESGYDDVGGELNRFEFTAR